MPRLFPPPAQLHLLLVPPFTPPTPTRFEHLSLEDGLSQNAVLDLLQDRDGFLWVATQDGLNRYDGYGFTVFKNDPDDPNYAQPQLDPAADPGQQRRDLGRHLGRRPESHSTPRAGKITRYTHNPADPTSLSNDTVAALWEDRHGSIWVGTMGGGLSRLDRVSGRFTHFRHKEGNSQTIASDFVSTIYEDAEGKLWLGTGGFGTEGAGVDRFDTLNETFSHFRHDPADPNTAEQRHHLHYLPGWERQAVGGHGRFQLARPWT